MNLKAKQEEKSFSHCHEMKFVFSRRSWNIGSIFHDTQRKERKSFISNWCQIKISFLFFLFHSFAHYMTIFSYTHAIHSYLKSQECMWDPFFCLCYNFVVVSSLSGNIRRRELSRKWNWLFFSIYEHTSPFLYLSDTLGKLFQL